MFRALSLLCWLGACAEPVHENPCVKAESHLVVETARHALWLCENNKAVRSYAVRLGKGGVGKLREGDGKVPLGEYPLAKPRPSAKFGVFIAIGYPTAEQRAKGYTGSAVGVHGPSRNLRWLGDAINWFDTTDGCVGLASDAAVEAVSSWVERSGAVRIILR